VFDYETFRVPALVSKRTMRMLDEGWWRRHCNRVAEVQHRLISRLQSLCNVFAENENCLQLCCCLIYNFMDILLSETRRYTLAPPGGPHRTLRTRYTNRLNPGNNRGIRNVRSYVRPFCLPRLHSEAASFTTVYDRRRKSRFQETQTLARSVGRNAISYNFTHFPATRVCLSMPIC